MNKSLIQGLQGDYDFILGLSNRKFGGTRQASLNPINSCYFVKHLLIWGFRAALSRPDIAHYAITSGWAMEKGLIFLGVARMFSAKTVGHLHCGEFLNHWAALPKWRRTWALRQLRKLDALIVLSEYWRNAMVEHVGISPERVFVVNNPIDRDFESMALQIPAERSEPVVLSLGVMGKDKGVMDALEAARLAGPRSDFRMELAGPEREPGIHRKVQEFINRNNLGNSIRMQSSVWGPEKLRLFENASIFLLPSYFENFPLVVLEAAASGQAIIMTPVGALPEFFEDGVSALFVQPGNVEQMADAITCLANEPELRSRLGLAARKVFTSRLARSRIMESLAQLYQQVWPRARSENDDAINLDRTGSGAE